MKGTDTSASTGSPAPMVTKIGATEGALDLIVRPGYAESGVNDAAYNWVSPFEEDTGCHVNTFEAGTS